MQRNRSREVQRNNSIEIESISHENIGKDTPFPEEMKSRTSHRLEYGIQSVVSVEYEYDSTGMHPLDPQADEKLASLITIPLGVRQIRVPLLKSIIRLVLGNFHSVFVRVYYPINEGAVEDARKLGLHVKKVGPDSLYCVFYSSLRGDSLSREDIRELLSEYSRQWMQEGRTSNWEVVFLNYDRFFRVRSPGDIVIDVCFNTISYTEVEERYGVKLNK